MLLPIDEDRDLARPENRVAHLLQEEPAPVNAGAVLELAANPELRWRGRRFPAPPTPFGDGVELTLRMDAVGRRAVILEVDPSPAALREYRAALAAAAEQLWMMATGHGLVGRLFRLAHGGRNPLRHATADELLELADFFAARRTISRVAFRRPTVPPSPSIS